jgi:DNA-binding response OmpR family regulator
MPRILVVDDDAMIRTLLRDVLERQGYDVSEAINGADGLQQYQATLPDLVITDLQMSVMDGFQLLQELQRMAPPPAVIAISGDQHTLMQARALTPYTFAKPLPLRQLLATVRALVAARPECP